MSDLIKYLKEEHFLQFVISVIVLVMYYANLSAGRTSNVLENFALMILVFWFTTSTNGKRVNDLNGDVKNLKSKVDTQETRVTKLENGGTK